MHATPSFTLLHLSDRSDIHIFWILLEYKQKMLNVNTKYSYRHESILSFLFTLYNNNLFWCMHLLTSSDLLFNKFKSSRNSTKKTFSVKHNVQWFGELLLLTFSTILHLTMSSVPRLFKLKIYFKSLVHFTYIFYV